MAFFLKMPSHLDEDPRWVTAGWQAHLVYPFLLRLAARCGWEGRIDPEYLEPEYLGRMLGISEFEAMRGIAACHRVGYVLEDGTLPDWTLWRPELSTPRWQRWSQNSAKLRVGASKNGKLESAPTVANRCQRYSESESEEEEESGSAQPSGDTDAASVAPVNLGFEGVESTPSGVASKARKKNTTHPDPNVHTFRLWWQERFEREYRDAYAWDGKAAKLTKGLLAKACGDLEALKARAEAMFDAEFPWLVGVRDLGTLSSNWNKFTVAKPELRLILGNEAFARRNA